MIPVSCTPVKPVPVAVSVTFRVNVRVVPAGTLYEVVVSPEFVSAALKFAAGALVTPTVELVVVAHDAKCAVLDQIGCFLDDIDRVRSIADQIAKQDQLVRCPLADGLQDCVERLAVGMDVRQDRYAHSPCPGNSTI